MAFTQTDVVDKAVILGALDTNDTSLTERTNVTAEMMIAKADAYLGYDVTTVDALLSILAEIVVTQITHYQNLRIAQASGATKRVTRGDYTVEYDTSIQSFNAEQSVFNSYEWILKKYKKLVSI
jgi:hypothetical protein